VALKTGWEPGSLAVSGDRIVAVANGTASTGTAWESTDHGATFHKVMNGADRVYQFGDLVVLSAGGGAFVGAPLSPSEEPGTTRRRRAYPVRRRRPMPTPQPTPAGGISRDEAVRIATNAVHPTADELAHASAGVEAGPAIRTLDLVRFVPRELQRAAGREWNLRLHRLLHRRRPGLGRVGFVGRTDVAWRLRRDA